MLKLVCIRQKQLKKRHPEFAGLAYKLRIFLNVDENLQGKSLNEIKTK